MKRRTLLKYTATAGTSLVISLGLPAPQKADAFLFALLGLGNPLLGLVFGTILRSAFSGFQIRTRQWWDNRFDAMWAQRELIARSFETITVAEVKSPRYSILVSGEQRESLGHSVALCLPETRYSESSTAAYAGPACIGMAAAAEYLRTDGRMRPDEVQAAVMPKYQQYAERDWRGWSATSHFTAYATEASEEGVLIRYDAVNPNPGGYGILKIRVGANRLIQIPDIKIQFV